MSNLPAGQGPGDGDPTGNESPELVAARAAVATLTTQLSDANTQIERLRGTQAANDRALQELRTEKTTLTTKVTDLEAANAANKTDLETVNGQVATLTQTTEQLTSANSQVEQLKIENERLGVLVEYAAKSPIIGTLAATKAIPQAETLEDFRAALDTITQNSQVNQAAQARQVLAGARPAPPSANGLSADELEAKGNKLILQQKGDEGIALIEQARALRSKTQ